MSLVPPSATPSPHAVVIGAGPTGLAAAVALGHRLERVTLIERYDVPDHTARRDAGALGHRAAALRRVLDAPCVVVRSGLEVVGLVFSPGRVLGVEVVPRGGGREPVKIAADLVVDATGAGTGDPDVLPDGLIVAGPDARRARTTADGHDVPDVGWGRSVLRAELAGAVLGRCLDEHLRQRTDLSGFSAVAQHALARAGRGVAAPVAAC